MLYICMVKTTSEMKVYHGNYIEILEIDLSKSVINRDFGSGF